MTTRIVAITLALISGPACAQTPAQHLERAKTVLAKIDGDINVPGLKEPVEVLRDKWGVAHIYAKNADDLFFAQGFVAAQDRLFQLDLWRRIGTGRMAEVIGPDGLEGDTFARLIRYRGDMDAEWSSYSPDTKQIATAFTNGINAYIKHVGKCLPIEFDILGYAPDLWEPTDVLGRMSGIVMSRNFSDEVVRAHLIDKLGIDKVRMLLPTDPPRDFAPAPGLDLKGIDSPLLKAYQAASRSVQFKPSTTESNNWVVAGNRSASGKPVLASDPHRAIALPSLRYLVHLNAPGWNVIGAGEPALPGVAIGHNERIAWGFTIVGTDQADIYVEETKPGEPWWYKVGADWTPINLKTERIRVKDKKIAHVTLPFSRHGPVIHTDAERNRVYTLRWAGSEPGGAAYLSSLAVGRAQNYKEFLQAIERWKLPALNFVYADKDDNIAWIAAGATPIRSKHDGLLPVPGNGGFEWRGYLGVKDLPQDLNPRRGWLATANHNILPDRYTHQIGYEFAAPYRFLRVKANLEAKDKFMLKDFQAMQHDDVSIPGQKLAKLASRLSLRHPDFADRVKIMANWDGRLSRDSQAGVIYAHWLPLLQNAVFGRHVPKELVNDVVSKSGLPTLFHVLENPDAAWFGKDPAGTRNRVLEETFVSAVKQMLGRNQDRATWGEVHTVAFRHPLASVNPLYAKTLNVGPFQRTGDGNTPNNTRYDADFKQIHGATYRHLFDLSDWDKGLATSAPGQSGQFGSPHYADLAPLWARGEYFPLAYSRNKVEEVTAHRLMLRP
ncbi:MAG TPA: penicillin acylase family protein [Gemmataceae bacterium]|nr:penicillin acylase family protein [Gemmataceae bacterium]